ncbi:unnamed protein product [Coregonus sp. 'balchen']|nr:unnamed protein product [Coregonus sp. 'balchen']
MLIPSAEECHVLPYKRQHSSDRVGGEVWFAPERHHLKPKAGTKVVVTKFPLGSVGVEDLMTLAKPFGTVVIHLVFPCKGFLEFGSHKEAVNMVDHFSKSKAFVISMERMSKSAYLRESPDSTTYRRAYSSKSHSSRHKSEETSKTSNSTNKKRPSTGKQPAEKVVVKNERKGNDIDLENKDLDKEGVQVEDEQSLLDEVGAGVNAKDSAPSNSASLVADSKYKGDPKSSELLADDTLEDSNLKDSDLTEAEAAVCFTTLVMELREVRELKNPEPEEGAGAAWGRHSGAGEALGAGAGACPEDVAGTPGVAVEGGGGGGVTILLPDSDGDEEMRRQGKEGGGRMKGEGHAIWEMN